MNVQWYYGWGDSRQGPFSAQQLQALAEAGKIQPGDTVWKEGVADGVPAHCVKHLFATATEAGATAHESVKEHSAAAETIAVERTLRADAEGEASNATPQPDLLPVEPEQAEDRSKAQFADKVNPSETAEPAAPPASKPPIPQPPPRKGRATAVRGAIIVSQDGAIVYFRKKCFQCGHEETGRSRLPIRNGVTRAGYFCPKCRKLRPVEIQGMT